jgi:hypothetical protein
VDVQRLRQSLLVQPPPADRAAVREHVLGDVRHQASNALPHPAVAIDPGVHRGGAGPQPQSHVGHGGGAGVLAEQHDLGDRGPRDVQFGPLHAHGRIAQRDALPVRPESDPALQGDHQEQQAADTEQQQARRPRQDVHVREQDARRGERCAAEHDQYGLPVEPEPCDVLAGLLRLRHPGTSTSVRSARRSSRLVVSDPPRDLAVGGLRSPRDGLRIGA